MEAKTSKCCFSGRSFVKPGLRSLPPGDGWYMPRKNQQSLLIQRFQLKYRPDIRQGPIYMLVRGKGPLKLQDSKEHIPGRMDSR
jgi:uncharacterized protein (TIGR03435 family)